MALLRPVTRAQLDEQMVAFERLVARELSRVASAAARQILASEPITAAAGEPYVSLDSLTVIGTQWTATVDGRLLPVMEQLYTGASLAWTLVAAEQLPGWSTAVVPPVSSVAAEQYLAAARNRLVGIGNDLWTNTRASLLEGFRAGEDIPTLAGRVRDAAGVTEPRATVIARTEVVSVSNAGSFDTARALGVEMTKVWLATPDDRTRPTHAEADGQEVPLDQPFEVGGAALDYPGDPFGPPEEVIQCRCSVGYEIPADMPPPPELEAAALVAAGEETTMPEEATAHGCGGEVTWSPPTTTSTLTSGHETVSWTVTSSGGCGCTSRPAQAALTAAAKNHDGAMIALIPAEGDAARLALDDGERAEELHVTLYYLGPAADWQEQARQQLLNAVQAQAAELAQVEAEAFAVSAFNPHPDAGRDTALVLGLNGPGLDTAHQAALAAVDAYGADGMPDQHAPWQPHLTVAYSEDLSLLTTALLERLGPVRFDRLRVAFAGETTDLPLAGVAPAATSPAAGAAAAATFGAVGTHETGTDDSDWDAAANEARLPSPMSMDTARAAYAWIENGRAEDGQVPKDACKFIHHNVSADGRPGAANLTACSASIAVLNGGRGGADIPAADRQGVYDHVAKHLRDAGREPAPLQANQSGEQAANLNEFTDGAAPTEEQLRDAAGSAAGGVTLQDEGQCPPGQHPMPDGTCMPDEEMPEEAGAGGEHFHTLMIVEGVSTGMRTFAEGALTWRTPPFSLRWQEREPEMGGHALAVGVGNIERAERQGSEIHGWGRLDLDSEQGLEFARKLASGFAPWVSIGLDESLKESDIELIFPEAEGEGEDEDEAAGLPLEALFMEPEQVIFHSGRIAELTAVTVPAQQEARIEALPALYEALTQRGIQVEAPAVARAVITAAAISDQDEVATITIPHLPPAWWFDEPTDQTPQGQMTITEEGRLFGYLAPAGVAHRSFPGQRVEVPMRTVDYSRWMGGEALVAGGGRVVAGPITMECGHLPPGAARDSDRRMEHYDNSCSVVAKARIGENRHGVWVAGALEPFITGDQISRMLACRLSGDWAPHPERPGWRELVAALVVPVPGFAQGRAGPSVHVREGALVAAAVPIRLAQPQPQPDTRPVLERMARQIGRDRRSRMNALYARVHHGDREKVGA